MAITYTWKIKQINTQTIAGTPEVVVWVMWEKIGTDELGNTGIYNGATTFTEADIGQDVFTPFDQLTEAQVVGWIQAKIAKDPIWEADINTEIENQINAKKNPIIEHPVPWETPTS